MSNGLASGGRRRRLLAHERSHQAHPGLRGACDSAHLAKRLPWPRESARTSYLHSLRVFGRVQTRGDGRLLRRWEESWEVSLGRDSPRRGAVATCTPTCQSGRLTTRPGAVSRPNLTHGLPDSFRRAGIGAWRPTHPDQSAALPAAKSHFGRAKDGGIWRWGRRAAGRGPPPPQGGQAAEEGARGCRFGQ